MLTSPINASGFRPCIPTGGFYHVSGYTHQEYPPSPLQTRNFVRRNTPFLAPPRFKLVFFNVRRIVSWDTVFVSVCARVVHRPASKAMSSGFFPQASVRIPMQPDGLRLSLAALLAGVLLVFLRGYFQNLLRQCTHIMSFRMIPLILPLYVCFQTRQASGY
jgi:hypothetical protein